MFKKNFMLILALLIPVITYGIAVFISFEPNVREWGVGGRYFYAIVTLFLSVNCFCCWKIEHL
jgi:hypothetical protein